MEWARLVVDYIDTLAWPLAVVGLVVFFGLRFRENIARLLDRVQEVKGPGGLGITTPPPGPGGQSPSDPSIGGAEADVLTGAMDNLATRLSDTAASLALTETSQEQLKNDYDALYAYYQFERIYRMVYGTQLLLMRSLAVSPERSNSEETLSLYFEEHVRQTAGVSGYTPKRDEYFAFLINSEMIEFDGEAHRYYLTDWGVVFLAYLDHQALSRIKAY